MKLLASRAFGYVVLVIATVLGAWLGTAGAPETANACSCAEPEWYYRLESVDAPSAAPDHREKWPKGASLSASGLFDGLDEDFGIRFEEAK